MITPAEIQTKEFTKGVRGYKEDEVDSFLDLVTLDMDKLIQENALLKENIRSLNGEIERYKGTESKIFDTLESAKALMQDISVSAEKRAEILLKNAELDAERIQREAEESVERAKDEAHLMVRRWEQFKVRYRNLLQTEMERFDSLSADFLIDNEVEGIGVDAEDLLGDQGSRTLRRSIDKEMRMRASGPGKDFTAFSTPDPVSRAVAPEADSDTRMFHHIPDEAALARERDFDPGAKPGESQLPPEFQDMALTMKATRRNME